MLEAKELKPFRALPLDRKVIDSVGDLGVPRIKKLPPTVPAEIHLRTQDRAERILEREKVDMPEEPEAQFTARPLPNTTNEVLAGHNVWLVGRWHAVKADDADGAVWVLFGPSRSLDGSVTSSPQRTRSLRIC